MENFRTKSRWLHIPFEVLTTKLKGIDRLTAEDNLKKGVEVAHRSVAKVTASIYSAIQKRMEDKDFLEVFNQVEDVVEMMAKPLDMQSMFTLMLFCSKKVYV